MIISSVYNSLDQRGLPSGTYWLPSSCSAFLALSSSSSVSFPGWTSFHPSLAETLASEEVLGTFDGRLGLVTGPLGTSPSISKENRSISSQTDIAEVPETGLDEFAPRALGLTGMISSL